MILKLKRTKLNEIYCYIAIMIVLMSSEAIYEYVYSWYDNFFKISAIVIALPAALKLSRCAFKQVISWLIVLLIIMYVWSIAGGATVLDVIKVWSRLVPIMIMVRYFLEKNVDILRCLFNSIFILVIICLMFYILFDIGMLDVTPTRYIWTTEDGYQYIYTNYLNIYYRWHRGREVLGYTLISANGFWHEPGAYQIYINLALFYALFIDKKIPKIKVILLICAVITSTSTMGLLLMTLLVFLRLFKSMKMWKIFLITMVGCCVIFYTSMLLQEKMMTANWLARTGNITQCIYLITKNPIFGTNAAGYSIFSGIFSYLILYGVLGLLPFYVIYIGIKNKSFGTSNVNQLAFISWWILSMINENYAYHNIIFLIYAICLFCNNQHRRLLKS